MSRVDPEFSHRRLQNVKFLGENDMNLFIDLRGRVESLQEPNEQVVVPAPNEAHAWSKLYATYRVLKKRRETDSDPAATVKAEQGAAVEREWNAFMFQRAEFLQWLAREPISSAVKEYIGLQADDLESPTVEGNEQFRGARRPDWRDIASRISSAAWKLKNMGAAERMNIPNIIAQRRMAEAINSLQERVRILEEGAATPLASAADTSAMTLIGTKH